MQPAALMHIPVCYRGAEIHALIDTACSSTVLQRSYVTDHIMPTPDVFLKGLSDNRVYTHGEASIEFSIGELNFSSKFVIVPDDVI